MRSILVVVGDELGEDRPEVLLVEDDQVVEALAAERPDHPFRDSIRFRRPNRGADGVDADASGALAEVAAIDRIAIV